MDKVNFNFNDVRAVKLIEDCINKLNLTLEGYIVLTEVGTGVYAYTPIIAALAGASKVIAVTRDSAYGKASETIRHCSGLLKSLNIFNVVTFETSRNLIEHIEEADIITNSGFLRPLNSELLKYAKESVVVPLMYEAWELRDTDVDISFCTKRQIKVAGTWENHPLIKVFDNVRILALKLCLAAGVEIHDNNIIVWSDDEFGEMAVSVFKALGANRVIMTTEISKIYDEGVNLDCIFIADYSEKRKIIGIDGIIDLKRLVNINSAISFVHLYGDVDPAYALENGFNIYPNKKGHSQVMTETLGHVGLKPIINLQTAGFKVAYEMLTDQLSDLSQPISF